MGALIGSIVGGIGSIVGGVTAANADKKAAKQALTGYNYLTNSPLIKNVTGNGATASNDVMSLLTSDGQNSPAFQNYLNSTGYNFQMKQGSDAITGNAAARGLLNSGATAKALTSYGQGLASNYFNTYLGQLNNLTNQGLEASQMVGQAGTTGGGNAGTFTSAGGQAMANGIGGAFGIGSNFLSKVPTPSFLGG